MICNRVLDRGSPESRALRWFILGEGAQRTEQDVGTGKRETWHGESLSKVFSELVIGVETGTCPAGNSLRSHVEWTSEVSTYLWDRRSELLNWLLDPIGQELSYVGMSFHTIEVGTCTRMGSCRFLHYIIGELWDRKQVIHGVAEKRCCHSPMCNWLLQQ